MAETSERWAFARGRRIICRVHRPTLGNDLPAIVYFHGGGWAAGSIDTHDRLAREYAAASGLIVISVDYALSPEAVFPQALEECVGVVRWLASNGAAWGIDCNRLSLAGDSAGGNLAVATALMLRDDGGPPIRGILAAYPVCDSNLSTESYGEFADGYGLSAAKMRFYWDCYAPEHQHDPLAAPLRADLKGMPATLIQLAELDVMRSEGEMMAARMLEAGVNVELEIFPGVLHGFMRATQSVRLAREAVAHAGAWLKAHA